MKSKNLNQILADLIMDLNSLDGKFLSKPASLYKIYEFNKTIRVLTTPKSYNAIDIYDILVFLNSAKKLGLLKGIDNDYINFTVSNSSKNNYIMSGRITITIPYNDRTLKVSYRPVLEKNNGNIEMEWVVVEYNENRRYSLTTDELHSRIIPDDRMSETKQLQFHSAKILSNAMKYYSNIIFRNLYSRYVH